ncbi:MAG: hypothetical protein ABIJ09_15815 [Pseudomonadota bacterium]
MDRRIRLGELLLRAGLITEMQLKAALAEQKKWGGRLGTILVNMNFISEDILVKGLARLLEVPRADFENMNVPDVVLQRFDPTDCQTRGYLPVQYSHAEKKLTVAFVDVNDLALVDELRFKHGLNIQPAITGEHALQASLRSLFYSEALDASVTGQEPGLKLIDSRGGTLVKNRAEIFGNEPPPAPVATTGVERAPAGVAAALPPPPVGGIPAGLLNELEIAQRRQSRAIKTVLELLIEKGVISREEFVASVNKRSDS